MLPTIGAALSIPNSRQQMITSVYNISSGCLILLWGRLADVYGRRIIFLVGSALFALSALITPFSPNEVCFYFFRALYVFNIDLRLNIEFFLMPTLLGRELAAQQRCHRRWASWQLCFLQGVNSEPRPSSPSRQRPQWGPSSET